MVLKQNAFSRNQTSNFDFFPELAEWYSLMMPGSSSKPQHPLSHVITRVNNQNLYKRSVSRQQFYFHFQCSIQQIIWTIQHFIIKWALC